MIFLVERISPGGDTESRLHCSPVTHSRCVLIPQPGEQNGGTHKIQGVAIATHCFSFFQNFWPFKTYMYIYIFPSEAWRPSLALSSIYNKLQVNGPSFCTKWGQLCHPPQVLWFLSSCGLRKGKNLLTPVLSYPEFSSSNSEHFLNLLQRLEQMNIRIYCLPFLDMQLHICWLIST